MLAVVAAASELRGKLVGGYALPGSSRHTLQPASATRAAVTEPPNQSQHDRVEMLGKRHPPIGLWE